MSRICSKDTVPEIIFRKRLHANGFRYHKHVKNLPGKPDIVLPKYNTVVFVHGDFWHGKQFKEWSNNLSPYWYKKISSNISRDRKQVKKLKKMGWKVLIVWEKDIKKKLSATIDKTISNLLKS